MINIKVSFLSLLADITGIKDIIMPINENSTIKDLLSTLILKFGSDFEKFILGSPDILRKYIILALNGKDIRSFDNLNTIIKDGDEVSFLPAIAGG